VSAVGCLPTLIRPAAVGVASCAHRVVRGPLERGGGEGAHVDGGRDVAVVAGLAATGAALCCWGLALAGYWPVAVALSGARVLPAANTTLAQGLLLAVAGGALLAAAAAAVAARRPARAGRPPAAGD